MMIVFTGTHSNCQCQIM